VHAVEAGVLGRGDVVELGDVLAGSAPGRASEDEITAFDSTGLAIQDLAIGIEVVDRYREDANAGSFPNVQEIDIG
jgi:ornithine cyclodeaminase/alanine dehydrogenase-like protein (mu-crystallin family)